jgi:hypothetical protein
MIDRCGSQEMAEARNFFQTCAVGKAGTIEQRMAGSYSSLLALSPLVRFAQRGRLERGLIAWAMLGMLHHALFDSLLH